MEERFPDCSNRARVVDISAQVCPVIDSAQDPPGLRDQMKQPEAGAIGGSAVDCKATLVTRLDPDAFVPSDGVADARLGTCGGDHDWFANGARSGDQCRESGRVDAVIVGDEKFHVAHANSADVSERESAVKLV